MWKKPSLAHPGMWLCLLGSVLALVAFFLPFYGLPPISLWGVLLRSTRPDYIAASTLAILWLGLLLLLLSGGVVTCWVACFRPPKWNILPLYLTCTGMALTWCIITALIAILIAWEVTGAYGEPFTDSIALLNVGAGLMPVSLIVAVRGGVLLGRRNPQKATKS